MDSSDALEERRKYITAFNDTMVRIWKERISMLGVVDTGALYSSVVKIAAAHDGKFTAVTLSQGFNMYGIYVDYGVGSNTPRGNPGDIGRANARRPRPWFSRKHYASVMNLRDFYADNLGRDAALVVSNALSREITGRFGPASS